MSIHPRFADAILKGTKRVEYRKRALAPDIETVLIYATAPVQQVIGRFSVSHHVIDTPARVWRRTQGSGGVARDFFDAYYANSGVAVGIAISSATRFERPWALTELAPDITPPQSFMYLDTMIHPVVGELTDVAGQLELALQ